MQKELEGFLKKYEEQLLLEAKRLENIKMPQLTEELFAIFENTGNRLEYENIYFLRRKYLSVYGILVALCGKDTYIHKLEEIIISICDEECWALPAHVDRKTKSWQTTIDLFATETASTLAELALRLKGKISEDVINIIKTEVFRRVLTPFIDSTYPYAWWENTTINWCAVCNGGIGIAAICLMKKSEKLDNLLTRITTSLTNYIDGFSDDGACLEGLSYYTYGLSYYVGFADMLYQYSNGNIDLLKNKKIKKIALFQQICFPDKKTPITFSDVDPNEKYRVGLTSYLATRWNEVSFPDISKAADLETDNCYRYLILSRDIIFTRRYLNIKELHNENTNIREFYKCNKKRELIKTQLDNKNIDLTKKYLKECDIFQIKNYLNKCDTVKGKRNLDTYVFNNKKYTSQELRTSHITLPYAQWSMCVSNDNTFLAIKGGNNDEPHNHNDVGNFIYASDGKYILTDIGAGEYTKDYFNDNRYNYLCCRSMGHNVPLIDGQEQKAGKHYKSTNFKADNKGNISIGLDGAYELSEDEKITREVHFELKDGNCVIVDKFALHKGRKVKENLISLYEPTVIQNGFVIEVDNKMYEIIGTNGENYKVKKEYYMDHYGVKKAVWIMQFDVVETKIEISIRKNEILRK